MSIELTQYDGSVLRLDDIPNKIVSMVPSVTESLIRWDIHPVGRTSFCICPKNKVESIPVIGGTKTPNIRKILKIKPDLVIANKEENTLEAVSQLQDGGVQVWVNFPNQVSDVVPYLKDLQKLSPPDQGHEKEILQLDLFLNKIRETRPATSPRCATFIWKDPWMVAGEDTYISSLIRYAGGDSVSFDPSSRYPEVQMDDILDAQLDFLFLPSEPYAFGQEHQTMLQERFSAQGQNPQVRLISGEDLTWPNHRVKKALQLLLDLFTSAKVR